MNEEAANELGLLCESERRLQEDFKFIPWLQAQSDIWKGFHNENEINLLVKQIEQWQKKENNHDENMLITKENSHSLSETKPTLPRIPSITVDEIWNLTKEEWSTYPKLIQLAQIRFQHNFQYNPYGYKSDLKNGRNWNKNRIFWIVTAKNRCRNCGYIHVKEDTYTRDRIWINTV